MAKKKNKKKNNKPKTIIASKVKTEEKHSEKPVDEVPKADHSEKPVDEAPKAEQVEKPVDESPEAEQAENEEETEAESEDSETEIRLKPETAAEIENSDKDTVFLKVAKAYEEVRHKRENYKKYGPLSVLITGVVFLTLMFSLENKVVFLIIWVITTLYTAALMIRAEYNYNKFRYYLGLADEEAEDDGDSEEEKNDQDPKDGQEENRA